MPSHRLEITYRSAWFTVGLLAGRCFPRFFLRWFATVMGHCYAACHPVNSRALARALEILESKKPPSPGRVFASFARVLTDYFIAGSRPLAYACSLIPERIGHEHIQAVFREGRGGLLLTPHFGFFELGGAIMKQEGFPLVILTDPEPSESLTRWRSAYRKRWDVETVVIGKDELQPLQILRFLKEGRFVAALFDRTSSERSSQARFPGGSVPCASSVLLLALLAKCPVIPMAVYERPDHRYCLHATPPIHLERKASVQQTLDHYSQVILEALWPLLKAHPDQWYRFGPSATAQPEK